MAKSLKKKKRLSKTREKKALRKRAKRVSKPVKKKPEVVRKKPGVYKIKLAKKKLSPVKKKKPAPVKKKKPKAKKIRIVTEPPGAIVKVDGKVIGTSPVEFTPEIKEEVSKREEFAPKIKKEVPAEHEPPEEFELIPPTELEDTVQTAGTKIRAAFEDAKTRFGYKTSSVIVHEYKYEVDGEWRIDGIRGEKTADLLAEMLEALLPMPGVSTMAVLGEGYWLTTGIRWQGKGEYDEKKGEWTDDDEDHYRKHEGMLEVSSNYRKMINRGRILSAFNAVLEGSSKNPVPMWKSVEKKFRHKIAQVFIRINWNPKNEQPKRNIYGPEK
jgi:hypothetical protein